MLTRKKKPKNIGSVISGTLRTEDVVPALVDALDRQVPISIREHVLQIRRIRLDIQCGETYFGSALAQGDINDLCDMLNVYAPVLHYFGTHPGDGSDHGFWLEEDWEEHLKEDGGIKVNSTTEIPMRHVGTVVVVNDHGNITCYRKGRNRRLYELWSYV